MVKGMNKKAKKYLLIFIAIIVLVLLLIIVRDIIVIKGDPGCCVCTDYPMGEGCCPCHTPILLPYF